MPQIAQILRRDFTDKKKTLTQIAQINADLRKEETPDNAGG
jgi:hypothetical protein